MTATHPTLRDRLPERLRQPVPVGQQLCEQRADQLARVLRRGGMRDPRTNVGDESAHSGGIEPVLVGRQNESGRELEHEFGVVPVRAISQRDRRAGGIDPCEPGTRAAVARLL